MAPASSRWGSLCHSSRECRRVSDHVSQGTALVQFAVLNFMAKNNFGKEFITYYSLGSIIKKSQGRRPRKEPGDRNWRSQRNATYWFALRPRFHHVLYTVLYTVIQA